MSNTFCLPVKIIEQKEGILTLEIISDTFECPQCQQGTGCGSKNKWFFFSLKKKKIFKLSNFSNIQLNQQTIDLKLPSAILNILASFTYGIPLFFYIASLFLTRSLETWIQFLCSLLTLILSFTLIGVGNSYVLAKYIETALRKTSFSSY